MNAGYYSDRHGAPRPRTDENIGDTAWGGIGVLIGSLIAKDAFADAFPDECPDGEGTAGTNARSMGVALAAEIPGIPWPLEGSTPPSGLAALDLIEFCYEIVAEPIRGRYHSFYQHYHLSFDRAAGQSNFRERINRIFARNGIAYELGAAGQIERLGPPILRDALASPLPPTGDPHLDRLLAEACSKILSPDLQNRRDSLEKLWDAWERVKTIELPTRKSASISKSLGRTTSESTMLATLDAEARELTRIGNEFQIRHHEVGKTPVDRGELVDYLFHRLYAMIYLVLLSRQRYP